MMWELIIARLATQSKAPLYNRGLELSPKPRQDRIFVVSVISEYQTCIFAGPVSLTLSQARAYFRLVLNVWSQRVPLRIMVSVDSIRSSGNEKCDTTHCDYKRHKLITLCEETVDSHYPPTVRVGQRPHDTEARLAEY